MEIYILPFSPIFPNSLEGDSISTLKPQGTGHGFNIAVKIALKLSKLSFKSLQYSFDIEQRAIEKPKSRYIDLMISEILKIHQPKLQLPEVRGSRRMRSTLGSYMPSAKQIAISSRLLAMGEDGDIREVVMHEVAHAIVHARFGNKPSAHGREFKAVCKELDIEPRRYVDVSTEKWQTRIRYAARCKFCNLLVVRKRRMPFARCVCGSKIYPKLWEAISESERSQDSDWVMI